MLRKSSAVLAISIAFSVSCVSSASAADLYAPSIKDDPVERVSTWTGVTIGAHGGYLWGDTDFPDAPNYVPPPVPRGVLSGPPDPNLEGGFLGAQIGYNHQFGKIVVGVEADISFADINDTVRDGNFITQTTELERFGTLRGRLGYAHGAWLPYVTGGLAWGDITYSQTCPQGAQFGHCSRSGAYTRSDDVTATGWTVGGGVKYAISEHFVVGAEYLHLDFGKEGFDFGPPVNGEPVRAADLEVKADVVKLSVDYKF